MGQAVVDLPDPLEKQPNSATSADDLLSQLAGDEIDRMLTEADVDASTPIEEVPAAQQEMKAHVAAESLKQTADSSTAAAVDDLLSTLDEQPKADATAEAAGTRSGTLDASEIDKLLDEAITPAAAEAATTDSDPKVDIDQALAAEADAKLAPQTAVVEAEVAAEVAHAEASAIAAPATLTPAATADEAHADESAERDGLLASVAGETTVEDDELAPLPIWLRPLEWLSAPMDGLSDEVRSFFGKVAILTLVNSAAVIAYVLIFRGPAVATASGPLVQVPHPMATVAPVRETPETSGAHEAAPAHAPSADEPKNEHPAPPEPKPAHAEAATSPHE